MQKPTQQYTPEQLKQIVLDAADKYNVDRNYAIATFKNESGGGRLTTSYDKNGKAVAHGIMQITEDTGKRLGYSRQDLYDPKKNAEASMKLIKNELIPKYTDDKGNVNYDAVAAAYHAGKGAIAADGSPIAKKGAGPKTAAYRQKVSDDKLFMDAAGENDKNAGKPPDLKRPTVDSWSAAKNNAPPPTYSPAPNAKDRVASAVNSATNTDPEDMSDDELFKAASEAASEPEKFDLNDSKPSIQPIKPARGNPVNAQTIADTIQPKGVALTGAQFPKGFKAKNTKADLATLNAVGRGYGFTDAQMARLTKDQGYHPFDSPEFIGKDGKEVNPVVKKVLNPNSPHPETVTERQNPLSANAKGLITTAKIRASNASKADALAKQKASDTPESIAARDRATYQADSMMGFDDNTREAYKAERGKYPSQEDSIRFTKDAKGNPVVYDTSDRSRMMLEKLTAKEREVNNSLDPNSYAFSNPDARNWAGEFGNEAVKSATFGNVDLKELTGTQDNPDFEGADVARLTGNLVGTGLNAAALSNALGGAGKVLGAAGNVPKIAANLPRLAGAARAVAPLLEGGEAAAQYGKLGTIAHGGIFGAAQGAAQAPTGENGQDISLLNDPIANLKARAEQGAVRGAGGLVAAGLGGNPATSSYGRQAVGNLAGFGGADVANAALNGKGLDDPGTQQALIQSGLTSLLLPTVGKVGGLFERAPTPASIPETQKMSQPQEYVVDLEGLRWPKVLDMGDGAKANAADVIAHNEGIEAAPPDSYNTQAMATEPVKSPLLLRSGDTGNPLMANNPFGGTNYPVTPTNTRQPGNTYPQVANIPIEGQTGNIEEPRQTAQMTQGLSGGLVGSDTTTLPLDLKNPSAYNTTQVKTQDLLPPTGAMPTRESTQVFDKTTPVPPAFAPTTKIGQPQDYQTTKVPVAKASSYETTAIPQAGNPPVPRTQEFTEPLPTGLAKTNPVYREQKPTDDLTTPFDKTTDLPPDFSPTEPFQYPTVDLNPTGDISSPSTANIRPRMVNRRINAETTPELSPLLQVRPDAETNANISPLFPRQGQTGSQDNQGGTNRFTEQLPTGQVAPPPVARQTTPDLHSTEPNLKGMDSLTRNQAIEDMRANTPDTPFDPNAKELAEIMPFHAGLKQRRPGRTDEFNQIEAKRQQDSGGALSLLARIARRSQAAGWNRRHPGQEPRQPLDTNHLDLVRQIQYPERPTTPDLNLQNQKYQGELKTPQDYLTSPLGDEANIDDLINPYVTRGMGEEVLPETANLRPPARQTEDYTDSEYDNINKKTSPFTAKIVPPQPPASGDLVVSPPVKPAPKPNPLVDAIRKPARQTEKMPQVPRQMNLDPQTQIEARLAVLPPEQQASLRDQMANKGIGLNELRKIVRDRGELSTGDLSAMPKELRDALVKTPDLTDDSYPDAQRKLSDFPGLQATHEERAAANIGKEGFDEYGEPIDPKQRNLFRQEIAYKPRPDNFEDVADGLGIRGKLKQSAPQLFKGDEAKRQTPQVKADLNSNYDNYARKAALKYPDEESYVRAMSDKTLPSQDREDMYSILSTMQKQGNKVTPNLSEQTFKSIYQRGNELLADPKFSPSPRRNIGSETAPAVSDMQPKAVNQSPDISNKAPVSFADLMRGRAEETKAKAEAVKSQIANKVKKNGIFGNQRGALLIKQGNALVPDPASNNPSLANLALQFAGLKAKEAGLRFAAGSSEHYNEFVKGMKDKFNSKDWAEVKPHLNDLYQQESGQPAPEKKVPILKVISKVQNALDLADIGAGLTHAVGSTVFNVGKSAVENPVRGAVDRFLAKNVKTLSGGTSSARQDERTYVSPSLSEIPKKIFRDAIGKGTIQGVKKITKVGLSPEELKEVEGHEFSAGKGLLRGALGDFSNLVGRTRAAFHEPSRQYGQADTESSSIQTVAANTGYKPGDIKSWVEDYKAGKPLSSDKSAIAGKIVAEAKSGGDEASLLKDNKFSSAVTQMKDRLYKSGLAGQAVGYLADRVSPFVAAHSNMVKAGFDRAIKAPIDVAVGVGKGIKQGGLTLEQRGKLADSAGKAVYGAAITGLGAAAGAALVANKSQPFNPFDNSGKEERELNRAANRDTGTIETPIANRRVTSLLLGAGRLPFQLGVAAADQYKSEKGLGDKALGFLGDAYNETAEEHPALKALGTAAEASLAPGGLSNFAADQLTSFVPPIVSKSVPLVRGAMGNTTYEKDTTSARKSFFGNVSDTLKKKTGVYYDELPDKVTALGDKNEVPTFQLFDPFRSKEQRSDENTTKIVGSLEKEGLGLSHITKKPDETQSDYSQREEVTGKLNRKNIGKLVDSDTWKDSEKNRNSNSRVAENYPTGQAYKRELLARTQSDSANMELSIPVKNKVDIFRETIREALKKPILDKRKLLKGKALTGDR